MKKNLSRPSRKEIRQQRDSLANLDFYRKMKRIRDAPPMSMMSSAQVGLRDLAKNLKELPDMGEAFYEMSFQQVHEECVEALESGQYEPLWRNLALFGFRLSTVPFFDPVSRCVPWVRFRDSGEDRRLRDAACCKTEP